MKKFNARIYTHGKYRYNYNLDAIDFPYAFFGAANNIKKKPMAKHIENMSITITRLPDKLREKEDEINKR